MCCSTKKLRSKKTPSVKAVNKDTDSDYDTEVYIINEVTGFRLDDLQSMTLKFESGNYLHFQPDTGAQCNVIPVHLYKKATKDHDLKCVTSKEVFQWKVHKLIEGIPNVEVVVDDFSLLWNTETRLKMQQVITTKICVPSCSAVRAKGLSLISRNFNSGKQNCLSSDM